MCGELSCFLIELTEASNLPSHPPVVKVFDVALQVHEIAAGPNKEGAEPSGEQFDRVLFAMPHRVSLCIQVDNMRGLIRALGLVISGDPSIIQPFDPFGWVEDSIAKGNVEVGDLSVVFLIAVGRSVKYIFIMLNTVVEPTDLFFEAANFTCLLGVASGDSHEEPFSNGSEDVHIEIGVGRQGGCNCTR